MSKITTAPTQGGEPDHANQSAPSDIQGSQRTLGYAQTYARAGVRVLRLRPRSKAAADKGWPDTATTDEAVLHGWFTGRNSDCNIGLAMGEWAGSPDTWLVCIDLDIRPDEHRDGVQAWQEIVAANGGDQGQPWVQHTAAAAGGRHLIYQVPVRLTNRLGALPAGVGIDVRGHGGYVMAEPSVHPDTGKSPRWDSGTWAQQPGMAPQWLLDLLTTQPAVAPAHTAPPLRVIEGGDRPGDRYNATHTWHDALARDGWQHCRTDGADEYWVRPGKSPRDGHSAVLHTAEGAHGVLVVFTTDCPPGLRKAEHLTRDGNAYKVSSPWAWYVATRHDGDHRTAASQVATADRHAAIEQHAAQIAAPPRAVQPAPTVHAAATSDEPAAPEPGHTYRLRTLADLIGQPDEPILPSLLLIEGSERGVMYAGETNLLAGPSGSGKSWALMVAVLQQARMGRRSVVLDYEMTLRQWFTRARLLGATDSELALIHHCRPAEPALMAVYDSARQRSNAWGVMRDEILAVAAQGELAVIALDGVTNALAADGLNANANDEVAEWWRAVPDYLARQTGAGVIVADHTPKHAEAGKAAPLGAQHKVAATSGAVLMAEVRSQMAREPELRDLRLLLRCAKDRHGEIGQGDTRHELVVRPAQTGAYGWGVHLLDQRGLAGTERDKVLATLHELNARTPQQAGKQSRISQREIERCSGLNRHRVATHLAQLVAQGLVRQCGTEARPDYRPAAMQPALDL